MATYECSLQGIVIGNKEKEILVQRLLGICGNESMMDLYEHEIVFTPTVQTPIGPARNDDVVLRLRSQIHSEQEESFKYRQWHLCMQGHPEPQRGRTVTVRPNIRVQLGGDAFRFMKSLGYSYSFEIVQKGHVFAYEKTLRITVSQVYKLKTKMKVTSAVPVDAEQPIWLINVTSMPVTQEQVNHMAEQLNKFKAALQGVVDLQYVDNRALQNRVQYTDSIKK